MRDLATRKALGQNFLVDPRVQKRIADACDLKTSEEIIEIGPGLGHLTRVLLPQVQKIYAIEKDKRFVQTLHEKFPTDKLSVIEADILAFDFAVLPAGLKIIGNLPYYISSAIIERLIEQREKFSNCFFTVQKEFAERLAAKPGCKDFGSLSCFVQYYADIKVLFKISAGSFKPVPKVDSSFVRMTFRPPSFKASHEEALFKLIRTAFSQRRKTIANALKTFQIPDQIFRDCGLTAKERAEDLSLRDYVTLINALHGKGRVTSFPSPDTTVC